MYLNQKACLDVNIEYQVKRMGKNLLLINDLAGYGKVALSAMIPMLSYMGHQIYNLPTALVSNTLDYGKFDILETTDYMRNTIQIWDELGFSFDAIATGFIVSEEQAEMIGTFCRKEAKKGTLIFVDPIMGDEGKLYNGVSEQTVFHMRKLAAVADYIVPNYTEAAKLTEMEYHEVITAHEADEMIRRLRSMGAKSVVITSICLNGNDTVVGFDHKKGKGFRIPFQNIPVRFPGTGDIFSAVLLGELLEGNPLCVSTEKAMETVSELIEKNRNNADKYKGIPIEKDLELLKDADKSQM